MQLHSCDSPALPLISAILAVRNEARHIEMCLKSLLDQVVGDFDLEIIIVDGESSDGTREIIERLIQGKSNVRLLHNPDRKTPFAFNLGIQHAKGEYICIFGAHTVYAENYIAVCFDELRKHGAAGCSGRLVIHPGDNSLQAQLIAWTLGHPFGTSSRSSRTHPSGFADTIPYPIFLKRALVEVGGYATHLHRNQDNDLSQKLRARGYKLYLTGATSCDYFVSPSLTALVQYAFKTGYWNWISLKENAQSMAFRHFAPFAFVFFYSIGLASFLASWFVRGDAQTWLRAPLVAISAVYLLAGLVAACQLGFRKRSIKALLVLPIFVGLHFSYGLGTFWGFLTNATVPKHGPNRGMVVLGPLHKPSDESRNKAAV